MKLIYLINSLIAARKRTAVLTMISVFFITVLFNYFFAASYDYITFRDYISRGDYENRMAVFQIQSDAPITDEAIQKLLTPAGFENSWEYSLAQTPGLLKANAPISSTEQYYDHAGQMTSERLESDDALIEYTREFSEMLETSYAGELPDINKDYGGKIPMIASFGSPYNIGDTMEYNFRGTLISVIITAKYTDDNLSRFAESNNRSGLRAGGSWLFADREIMYKYGAQQPPDKQESFVGRNDSEESGQHYRVQIYIIGDKLPFAEFFDRVTIADQSGDDIYSITEVGSAMPSVSKLDSDNRLIICSLPLFVIIFLIGSIGAAANGFLNLDSRRKSLAVLKLCGMKRKSLIPVAFACETAVTAAAAAAALIFSAVLGIFLQTDIISPLGALVSSLYIVTLSVVMTAVQIISVERDNSLEVIRRYENI